MASLLNNIGNSMADSIVANGHYQGQESDNERVVSSDEHFSECLASNDALPWESREEVFAAILTAAGLPVPSNQSDLLRATVKFNDENPTDKVLDTLRSIG